MGRSISKSMLQRRLFLFGLFKIRMIGFCRPQIVSVDEEHINVHIPLRRKTRNHVGSMYLGVMSVGADLASGFLAYYLLETHGLKAAPVFGGMQAEYLKRAEKGVDFRCHAGKDIQKMIEESKVSGERVTRDVEVLAHCGLEVVAKFQMGLSIKVL